MLATARRYSSGSDDAEDAYQRAAEIVVKHRPTGTDEELLRWLRTTVKHEALAIRRHRARVIVAGEPERLPEPRGGALAGHGADAHDQAERLERLSLGAQALRRLKPQEIRALQLKAEGYSYAEICEITQWTYTKVNRCLSEGRQAFRQNLAGIEAGLECERLAPQLSALADRECSAEDIEALRPHLRTCLICRARLREYRATPAKVAALVPLGALAPGGAEPSHSMLASLVASVQERWASLMGMAQERASIVGERLNHAAEMAAGQKAVAIAASTAALAGGGAVTADLAKRDPDRTTRPAVTQAQTQPQAAPTIDPNPPAPAPEAAVEEQSEPTPSTPEPVPPSSGEFGPEASAAPAPAPQPTAPRPAPTPSSASGTDPGGFEQ
jgi:RNA polymerase sigma factor (sigma-70 family)